MTSPNQASADPVAVTVPNITSGIDAVLEQGGSISGTVRNGQGFGIANVQVQVYDAADMSSTSEINRLHRPERDLHRNRPADGKL